LQYLLCSRYRNPVLLAKEIYEQVNTQMKNEKSNRILFRANKMPVFSFQKIFNEHIISKIQLPSVNKCLKKAIGNTPLPTSINDCNPLKMSDFFKGFFLGVVRGVVELGY